MKVTKLLEGTAGDEYKKFCSFMDEVENKFMTLSTNNILQLLGVSPSSTLNPASPSFILPDGKFLAVSDVPDADGKLGTFTHSSILGAIIRAMDGFESHKDTGDASWNWYPNLLEYLTEKLGWIRINCGNTAAEHRFYCVLPKSPTRQQFNSLLEWLIFGEMKGRPLVLIYIHKGGSGDYDNYGYNFFNRRGVKYTADEILGLIKRYYSSGTFYESAGGVYVCEHHTPTKTPSPRRARVAVRGSLTENVNGLLGKLGSTFEMSATPIMGPSYVFPDGRFIVIPEPDEMGAGVFVHYKCHSLLNLWLVSEKLTKKSIWDINDMTDILDAGAIKVNLGPIPDEDALLNYIELPKKSPTTSQYYALIDWLDLAQSKGIYDIEVNTYNLGKYKKYSLKDNTSDEIVAKIKRYYSSGTLYEDMEEDEPSPIELATQYFDIVSKPPKGASFILPDGGYLDLTANGCAEIEKEYYIDVLCGGEWHGALDYLLFFNELADGTEDGECFKNITNSVRCNTSVAGVTSIAYITLPRKALTSSQYQSIEDWLYLLQSLNHKIVRVSLSSYLDDGDEVTYSFEEYLPEDIVKKIKRYYSSGKLYEAKLNNKDDMMEGYLDAEQKFWDYGTAEITPGEPIDRTKTGISYYDSFLNSKEAEYMREEENRVGEVVMMSPEEYYQECGNYAWGSRKVSADELKRQRGANKKTLEKLKQVLTVWKKKLCMPMINYADPGQEGLHRMYVIGELYGWDFKVPVLTVRVADEERARKEAQEKIDYHIYQDVQRAVGSTLNYTFSSMDEFNEQLQWSLDKYFRYNDYLEPPIKFTLNSSDKEVWIVTVEGVDCEFWAEDIKWEEKPDDEDTDDDLDIDFDDLELFEEKLSLEESLFNVPFDTNLSEAYNGVEHRYYLCGNYGLVGTPYPDPVTREEAERKLASGHLLSSWFYVHEKSTFDDGIRREAGSYATQLRTPEDFDKIEHYWDVIYPQKHLKVNEGTSLTEDIASVRKNYPKISDDDFATLIRLDPTFREDRDSVGTYGKWILTLFNKGKIKPTDYENVTQMLDVWETNKKRFSNKDIGQFKELSQLEDALLNMPELELSHRQQVRQNQKARRGVNLGTDAELVLETSNWEVYIPKTYAASCKLGQGTSWCTATTESSYHYEDYSRKGPLYIIINKSNDKEKYQFHFETNSFMDTEDEPIRVTKFLLDNEDLGNLFWSKLFVSIGLPSRLSIDKDWEITINRKTMKSILDDASYVSSIGVDTHLIYDFLYTPESASEEFYYEGYYEGFLQDAINDTSDANKKLLEKAGVDISNLKEIISERGDLYEAYIEAIKTAMIPTIAEDAQGDCIYDLEASVDPLVGEFNVDEGEFYITGSVKTFLSIYDEYFSDDPQDGPPINDSYLEDAVFNLLMTHIYVREPELGWGYLPTDEFNDALETSIKDWFHLN